MLRRRQLRLLPGDVVVKREPLPRVNPRPMSAEPQWRYRVSLHDESGTSQYFDGFVHAATRAEQLASDLRRRIMFVEDDVASMLADYRRR